MANKRLREEMFETARGLYDLGVIDAETLREFDASKLAPVKSYRSTEIKRLRLVKKRGISPIFTF